MSTLTSHADVVKAMSGDVKVYAWDFIFCSGDSIREKAGSLHDIVTTLCVRGEDSRSEAAVVAHQEVASLLVVIEDIDNIVPEFKPVGDLQHMLTAKSNLGNGYKTDYALYADDELRDEVVVRVGETTSVIKIFNYPW